MKKQPKTSTKTATKAREAAGIRSLTISAREDTRNRFNAAYEVYKASQPKGEPVSKERFLNLLLYLYE